jgi:hypothetical protein
VCSGVGEGAWRRHSYGGVDRGKQRISNCEQTTTSSTRKTKLASSCTRLYRAQGPSGRALAGGRGWRLPRCGAWRSHACVRAWTRPTARGAGGGSTTRCGPHRREPRHSYTEWTVDQVHAHAQGASGRLYVPFLVSFAHI